MSGTVAIVGAGICGLGSSLALARQGYKVTIYERDSTPPAGGGNEAFFNWQRNGAGQFRHPHAFLGLMCNLLQDNYPDLLQDFIEAGALRVELQDMLPPAIRENYVPEDGDERLWILMCRRATMETVLRSYVERQPGIELINQHSVTGLLCKEENEQLIATGLQLGDNTVAADIVVDASGRTTHFPRWFKEMGREIREEKDAAEIVYYTRHYQLNPGVEEPSADGAERPTGDLGYLKYGLFKCEDGHFSIIVCVPVAEKALRKAVNDPEQFHRICLSIPGLAPWVNSDISTPTTDSFGFADIHAVWRHYVQDGTKGEGEGNNSEGQSEAAPKPIALNFFSVGDSSIRTNPLYGRGCSTGMLHAHILADVIASEADPVERALEFNRRSLAEIRPIFNASLDEDRKAIVQAEAIREGNTVKKSGGLKQWFAGAFGDAMAAALTNELHVIRGFLHTFHLLEKPGEFLQDKHIRRTIYRYMLKGRKKNAAARIVNGPDRHAMLQLLSEHQ